MKHKTISTQTRIIENRKPWVPSNGQNWANKDLVPRVTFPPWHIPRDAV